MRHLRPSEGLTPFLDHNLGSWATVKSAENWAPTVGQEQECRPLQGKEQGEPDGKSSELSRGDPLKSIASILLPEQRVEAP